MIYSKPSPSLPYRPEYQFNVAQDTSPRQAHLENFFGAIRGREPLACPASTAFATTVVVQKINQAIAAGGRVTLTPQDVDV
ncbi:MAG: hypothetical protein JW810_06870 [Sedimentisphaerales bacterium]|nr:hypothetical protein [Sedimentisphaerales bacterium]